MPSPDPNNRGSFSSVGVLPPVRVISWDAPAAPPPPRPALATKWSPMDFVVKDDDDFTAGPGDFIPVPKTSMRFWVEQEGPAIFMVQATFGWTGFPARNDHLGLLIDGAVYPLVQAEGMLAAAGTGLFKFGGPSMWPMNLGRGEHHVQVLLRGGNDDGEIKIGMALPCKVLANPKSPLSLMVMHS